MDAEHLEVDSTMTWKLFSRQIQGFYVALSKRTGMSISQVTDEVLYTGLIEMQEMDEL